MPNLRVHVLRDLLKHGIKRRVYCDSSPSEEIEAILAMAEEGAVSIAPYPPGADRYEFIDILGFREGAYRMLREARWTSRLLKSIRTPVFWAAVGVLSAIIFGVIRCYNGTDTATPKPAGAAPSVPATPAPKYSPALSPESATPASSTPSASPSNKTLQPTRVGLYFVFLSTISRGDYRTRSKPK